VTVFGTDRGATLFSDGLAEYEAASDGSLVLTLLIVPVFYLKLDDGIEWIRRVTGRRPRPGLTAASRPS